MSDAAAGGAGAPLDVLIPTFERPAALAITLTSLIAQTHADLRVVVSDQSRGAASFDAPEVMAAVRVLRAQGREVELHRHLPRRGLAEQRRFLLGRASARYCLFIDDDLILEPDLVERLWRTIGEEGCGLVGCGLIGLSFIDDVRPHEQALELWEGPVEPELVTPGSPEWERHKLHNAANLHHVARRLGLSRGARLRYKLAWAGGCVLYDAEALRDAGGFEFWEELPALHAGEDVLAQLRVMARRGGCGILPSGAYHQELPTTIAERPIDAPWVLPVVTEPARASS
ncbi:MAG: glycosyltransferase [Actinobacteria bacterium]|nr:glycosyltransferase [Actinomycetota bacterium]